MIISSTKRNNKIMQKNQQRGFGVVEIVIVLALVALLGVGGWYVWQQRNGSQMSNPQNGSAQTDGNQNTNHSVSKIPELGVEFDVKNGITPLYKVGSTNSVNGTTVSFSTQQVVDKGSAAANGGANVCRFDPTDLGNSYIVAYFTVYASANDAAKADRGPLDSPRPTGELTPQNGFITIGSKIYFLPTGVTSGGNSNCLPNDSVFLSQQWQNMHDSLMTLRTSQ
jgi:type II secretory pathway pseudopilin PulG